jgi:PilZ domain
MDTREALMVGAPREQRTAIRFFTTVAVTIYADDVRHVGLLRDFSAKGLFVYSDFRPACGAALRFTLRPPKNAAKRVPVECRGKVVRIEAAASGAAIGIAVEVDKYKLLKNSLALL